MVLPEHSDRLYSLLERDRERRAISTSSELDFCSESIEPDQCSQGYCFDNNARIDRPESVQNLSGPNSMVDFLNSTFNLSRSRKNLTQLMYGRTLLLVHHLLWYLQFWQFHSPQSFHDTPEYHGCPAKSAHRGSFFPVGAAIPVLAVDERGQH